jgi:hypothetical protein
MAGRTPCLPESAFVRNRLHCTAEIRLATIQRGESALKQKPRPVLIALAAAALILATIACNLPGGETATAEPVQEPTTEAEALPEAPTGEPAEQPPEESAEAPPEDEGAGEEDPALQAFETELLNALAGSRDYEALQAFMGDPFMIAGWQAGGSEVSPAEAAERLRTSLLPPDNVMTYTLDTDIEALIGQDPYTFFPGGVRFIFTEGWGGSATGEAILIIKQKPDGGYYWSGVLVAEQGFGP